MSSVPAVPAGGSPAYAQFKIDRGVYNKKWVESKKGRLDDRDAEDLMSSASKLLKNLEKYLQNVSAEVKPKLQNKKLVIAYDGFSPCENLRDDAGHSLWDMGSNSGEPTIWLRHSAEGIDEFDTDLTWSEAYAFVYALRNVDVHGTSERTLVTGCFKRAARQKFRNLLMSYVYPDGTPMGKGSSVSLSLKRRHQWARDSLAALDLIESTLKDPQQQTRTDIPSEDNLKAEETLRDHYHWFFRTWLSRMVTQLGVAHIMALGRAGLVTRTGPGEPGERARIKGLPAANPAGSSVSPSTDSGAAGAPSSSPSAPGL